MNIQSQQQLANTCGKLKLVEDRPRDLESKPVTNPRTRELNKQSLKKLANQLKEEIVRFESRQAHSSK